MKSALEALQRRKNLSNVASFRRNHSSVITPCSTSSLRLCTRTAFSAASVQASARCWYQSIASSSSISEMRARCRLRVPSPSSSAGSCRPSWLMRGQYKDRLSADQIRDQYEEVGRMTDSLDDGRVSFGNRDEIELATAVDPVCG